MVFMVFRRMWLPCWTHFAPLRQIVLLYLCHRLYHGRPARMVQFGGLRPPAPPPGACQQSAPQVLNSIACRIAHCSAFFFQDYYCLAWLLRLRDLAATDAPPARTAPPEQLVRAIQDLAEDAIESSAQLHERIDRLSARLHGLWAYINFAAWSPAWPRVGSPESTDLPASFLHELH